MEINRRLIEKYHLDECTEEERKLVEAWLFSTEIEDLAILPLNEDKLDHKNINMDVAFMKGKMASTEVLTMAIWDQLEPQIKSDFGQLHSIRLHETERNYVEYFGPNSK